MTRKILIFPMLLLMSIGMIIGFVICPLWFGVLVANELVGDLLDKARDNVRRRQENQK
jgi:hypothetical protein